MSSLALALCRTRVVEIRCFFIKHQFTKFSNNYKYITFVKLMWKPVGSLIRTWLSGLAAGSTWTMRRQNLIIYSFQHWPLEKRPAKRIAKCREWQTSYRFQQYISLPVVSATASVSEILWKQQARRKTSFAFLHKLKLTSTYTSVTGL